MDIIQMPVHIILIANDMIPEAILPDFPGHFIFVSITPGIGNFKLMHDFRNTNTLYFNKSMKMIWHYSPSFQMNIMPTIPE